MAPSEFAANYSFCPIPCPSQMAKNTISFISDHIPEISNQQPAEAQGKATWPESVLLVIAFLCAMEETEVGLRDSPQSW